MGTKPHVFVGSSKEKLTIARHIRKQLGAIAEVTIWDEGPFPPGQITLDALDRVAEKEDFVVLVMDADDVVEVRDQRLPAPRDNLIFEAGFFISHLGRERTILVYDGDHPPKIPSDLAGLLAAPYHSSRTDGNILAAVGEACHPICARIAELGCRPPFDAGPHQEAAQPRPQPRATPQPWFPIGAPARLIYTCRSTLSPSFQCPDPLPSETRSICLHAPVDEVETVALTFSRYPEEVLGSDELEASKHIFCSAKASSLLTYSPELPDDTNQSINPELVNNLIIVGENRFSNRLFPLLNYPLPWRYLVFKAVDPIWPQHTHYQAKMIFKNTLGFRLHPDCAAGLAGAATQWGLLTYIRNPFAPDRWLLLLLGCSRPGQYALLHWLRQKSISPAAHLSQAQESLSPASSLPGDGAMRFCQIAVWGEPRDNQPARGRILRNWHTPADGRYQDGCGMEQISAIDEPPETAKPGDEMADLSLLARVPPKEHWLGQAYESLPQNLRSFAVTAGEEGSIIGPHVTLFEFFHYVDRTDSDPTMALMQKAARHMTSERSEFLRELRTLLDDLPDLHFVARQAHVTQCSIQVLGDLVMDRNEFEAAFSSGICTGLCAMDSIVDTCVKALRSYRNVHPQQPAFAPFRIPYPLHVTLARLPNDADHGLREQAVAWAEQHRLRVWGRSRSLKMLLTAAYKLPFNDFQAVQVR